MVIRVQVGVPRVRIAGGIVVAQVQVPVHRQAVGDHDIVRLVAGEAEIRRRDLVMPGIEDGHAGQ